jgi:hypothetical protein
MRLYRPTLWLWLFLIAPAVLQAANRAGSGFATSDNFTVLTPKQAAAQKANAYAEDVLRTAERLRRQIARDWLGEELPPRQGRTIVTVSFESDRDAGLTWAIDNPRRTYHSLYLATSPELALGATLTHEMVHVVLATRFPHPNRLPAWLEEGIASHYDDADRQQEREDQLDAFIQTDEWPRVADVFNARTIAPTDIQAYTVAASVTALLLSHDGRAQRIFAFGQHGNEHGWDTALRKYYDIAGVDELQSVWQCAVSRVCPSGDDIAWGTTQAIDPQL